MIRLVHALLSIFIFSLCSCTNQNTKTTVSIEKASLIDTVYVSELTNASTELKLFHPNFKQGISLENPLVAKITKSGAENSYLAILEPGKNTQIVKDEYGNLQTNSIADSLLNYLWHSNQDFISKKQDFIFTTSNLDSVVKVFENFKEERRSNLKFYKNIIDPETFTILEYQNESRIYSFLFYFGRIAQELEAENSFFNFIESIPSPDIALKSLPDIYLYKYEIEYLREHEELKKISDFLHYIENETSSEDLSDYLKASYIKELIQTPSYWYKHEKLFNSQEFDSILSMAEENRYSDIIINASKLFSILKSGDVAANFSAIDKNNEEVDLNDFKGKVLFIDVWATWCAPCLSQRPQVLELARKYEANPNFEVLMVSVDSSKDKWQSFLDREKDSEGINLFIKDGLRSSFRENYNVKSIPRYILIDEKGKLINSDIGEPSIYIEQIITKALLQIE
ncbi:TlpA family protein disulfide reductase [Leeuwenhoekiella nanhaiensis]|uniref:Thioredoxin domain-containing protein n=1 Tax=Leeuwenhoekiella nanhaiensis TaxID=1655491 RepID=A0A2G1VMC8_9FLAO|nr:TlpA disulfide reductase family protein [Leeuwenhoekiella nanhaiensis]PHQ27913.1 hypothetical protein CJ305_17755 [Leeuwenhoekiella nanhaiensis]